MKYLLNELKDYPRLGGGSVGGAKPGAPNREYLAGAAQPQQLNNSTTFLIQ